VINTLELKAAIIKTGMKRSEVAEKLGISYYSFHKKLHNKTEFKASEISKLSEILNISDKDKIFFAQ